MAEGRPDPVSLVFRYVLDERRRSLFPRGARVLDLGTDLAAVRSRGRAASEAGSGGAEYDAAWAGPGAFDGVEPLHAASRLAGALRRGAPLLLCVRNPRPLPGLLARALTGEGDWQGRRAARIAGRPAPPSPRDVREAFGRGFAWRGGFALGLLLPAPGHAAWAAERPQLFGLLAAAESLLRRQPLLRGLGTFMALEGVRL